MRFALRNTSLTFGSLLFLVDKSYLDSLFDPICDTHIAIFSSFFFQSDTSFILSPHITSTINMSAEEDLIDYSDEEPETTKAPTTATNGAAKKGDAAAGKTDSKAKGSYVGIHATGFKDFLLKSELLRAIQDCGFEHPSEG